MKVCVRFSITRAYGKHNLKVFFAFLIATQIVSVGATGVTANRQETVSTHFLTDSMYAQYCNEPCLKTVTGDGVKPPESDEFIDWFDADDIPDCQITESSAGPYRSFECSETDLTVIIGPPGTGKTTTLVKTVARFLKEGIQPSEIAFVGFTRAACEHGKSRVATDLGVSPTQLRWFKTIHAICYKLCGCPPLMDKKAWALFAAEHGYNVSENHQWDSVKKTRGKRSDADLLAVGEWGRANMLPLEMAWRRCPVQVDLDELRAFWAALKSFKRKHELMDFTDLLEFCHDLGFAIPDIHVFIIDEAQDLSPLQASVAQCICSAFTVIVAGDDDQAIFSFAGADPTWLISLKNRAQHFAVLDQSYRLPRRIHAMSQRIIRQNRNRISKSFKPLPSRDGQILELEFSDAFSLAVSNTEATFVLARDNSHLRRWIKQLEEQRILFRVNGSAGESFFDDFQAVRCASMLAAGRCIPAEDFISMLAFVPSRKGNFLQHGDKSRAEKLMEERVEEPDGQWRIPDVDIDSLSTFGFRALCAAIKRDPLSPLFHLPPKRSEYFRELLHKHNGLLPDPKITISSIHRVKGGEAGLVIIIPDLTKQSWDSWKKGSQEEFETENRVAFVAVTRSKNRLVLVKPKRRKFYPYQDFI